MTTAGESHSRAMLDALRGIWLQRRSNVLARVGVLEQAISAALAGRLTEEQRFRAAAEAHMLAGSAGTFGFAAASERARELELALEAPAPPDAQELPRLRDAVRTIRRELEAEPGAQAPPGPVTADTRAVDLLLVGSDRARLEAVAAEVGRRGLHAELALGRDRAEASIEALDPPLVVLDLAWKNGLLEARELIEEVAPQRPVLVIAEPDVDRVEIASRGGRGFLPASLSVDELVDCLLELRGRARGSTRTVLCVDDDETVLAALRAILREGGFNVLSCQAPARFWHELAANPPDLVILDLEMPRASGIELCREMRADPRWETIPVLILTASNDPDAVRSVFEAGADDFVLKSFVGPELLARVANRLDRVRLYRALAETDHLTRLDNRRRSTETLEGYRAMSQRLHQPLALAVLDVDGFKQINDQGGHALGDAALRGIGAALASAFSAEDVIARWGGDEFIVGMYAMSAADARERVARALEEIRAKRFGPGQSVGGVTLSAGIAELGTDGPDIDALYRAADRAMYSAKSQGGDRVAVAGEQRDPGGEDADVLLAVADQKLLPIIARSLRTRGWQARSLHSGSELTRELARRGPQAPAGVVVLDRDLPELDGQEVLAPLTAPGAGGASHVIVLGTDEGETAIVPDELTVETIAKPVRVPQLVQRVRIALTGATP